MRLVRQQRGMRKRDLERRRVKKRARLVTAKERTPNNRAKA